MIRFSCPGCLSVHERSDREAETKFNCSVCGQRVQVPSAPRKIVAAHGSRASRAPTTKDGLPEPRSPLRWIIAAGCSILAVACCVLIVLANYNRSAPARDSTERSSENAATSEENRSGTALARQAHEILRTHCYRCHGEKGAAEGGFNFVLDRERLIARKKLVPGNAERSKLFRRIQQDEMPPADETPRPGRNEIALLKQWIDAGAPAEQTPASRPDFIGDAQVASFIHSDLPNLPERDRRFARYFTIAHLANAGLSEDELQTYRFALAKLVNSLSWNKDIVVPRPVDSARTVFRIDIRDYTWNDRVWGRLLAAYPHGVLLDTPEARTCYDTAGGQLSYVRADWFVAAASRPPLYHELLQLPETERALGEQLHLDVREDVRQERVTRAGFNGSGVSRNNRLIERHASPYGSYWRSYDFANNSNRRNLFAHPLGPGPDANGFECDGGEVIFHLPNGLHAFLLVDARGRRLDKAPSAIVSDARRPDRAVENGVSCMSCHARGLIPKEDRVRPHVESNPNAFTATETDAVKALYPLPAALAALFAKDNARYRQAVERSGGRLTTTEPIAALVLQYEKELDLLTAAAEVGMRPNEFAARLDQSPELGRTLGPLRTSGGTIQRQVFIDAFPDLVRELKLGAYLSSETRHR
jgi:mono/diheme cytochrome c family protein